MRIDLPSHLSDDELIARVNCGEKVAGYSRDAGRGRAEPGDGAAARVPSDGGEPPGASGCGSGQEQAAGRGAAGPVLPSAGRSRFRPQAAGSQGLVLRSVAPAASAANGRSSAATGISDGFVPASSVGLVAALPAPPARRPLVKPLAPERYEIRFTASAKTREKLLLAQDLLRHAIPTGDLAQVMDRALTLLLEDLARKTFAATERPRASRGTARGSRDVAAKVRRGVGFRDDGVCTFVSKSGRRCNARAFVEFHHVEPHAIGGEVTVENIHLRSGPHNRYESELFYGHERPARPTERITLPGKSSPWPQKRPAAVTKTDANPSPPRGRGEARFCSLSSEPATPP